MAAPYKDGTAKEVIEPVTQFWIAPFGTPIVIQCDNGPLFTAHVTREFMKINDISQVFTTPYHPQCNGLVERQNRTLISMLRVVCSRYQTDWFDHLATVMGAFNSTRHKSTGLTPFLLWFGRMPITKLFPVEQAGTTAPEEYAAQLAKRAVKLHKLTRDNLQQAQVRQKKNYDKNADKLYSFEKGDQVMLLVKVVPRGGMGKLIRLGGDHLQSQKYDNKDATTSLERALWLTMKR